MLIGSAGLAAGQQETQAAYRPYQSISKQTLTRSDSLILSHQGIAYLHNPETGTEAPFLE
ncbi:MAG: hypothetical protein HZB13_20865 [Acidobacteria bacterium]|nr:hypothetical protein [Acidobacteriota bacterium]